MPANNGFLRRKSRREEALVRRMKDVEGYSHMPFEELVSGVKVSKKIDRAKEDVERIKHNLTLPKRGRTW